MEHFLPLYEPELVAHVAARLNIEFDHRFAMNIVGGWKKDEFDYFKKEYLGSSEKIYEFAASGLIDSKSASGPFKYTNLFIGGRNSI